MKNKLIFLLKTLVFLGLVVALGYGLVYVQKFLEHKGAGSSSSQVEKLAEKQEEEALPDVSTSDWELILVNREHVQEDLKPKLAQIEDVEIDSRILQATEQFLAAAREIAPSQTLISGYRSRADQEELYNERIAAAEEEGFSQEEAESIVQKQVQIPGASEHQTGLAIDMSDPEGQDEEIADQIKALAPKYGFVLRYPDGKSDITGVDFENWHFRYVGPKSAGYMEEHHLVLEEYIKLLQEAGK